MKGAFALSPSSDTPDKLDYEGFTLVVSGMEKARTDWRCAYLEFEDSEKDRFRLANPASRFG
jgi:hypothetical protein